MNPPCWFCQYTLLISLSLNHGIFQVARSLVFLSSQQWVLSGIRGLKPGFRSVLGFWKVSTYLFPAASMYLSRALQDPLLGSLACRAEMVLLSSDKDALLDKTLVRLRWTLFWTRPCPWPAEPSLARIPPPTHWISNQFPLSNFPSIDPITLVIGYTFAAVFAVFGIQLISRLKSLSPTAVAEIKPVQLFLNKCWVQFRFDNFSKLKAHSFSVAHMVDNGDICFFKKKVPPLPTG